ncbi:MAG: cobaltochelatase subunit CobN, partial [Methanospirillum sp.]|uniref:cobaltochelatase subunit CobN n=1 Tax=Methanospirillum sp. TaxID=45200 RepID=UPI00236AAA56
MKITGIVWGGELPLLKRVCDMQEIIYAFYTSTAVREEEELQKAIRDIKDADLILIHPSPDPVWDDIIPQIPTGIPVVPIGFDQEGMSISTVQTKVAATASAYYIYGGEMNIGEMVKYLRAELFHESIVFQEPQPNAWDGIYHPDSARIFSDPNEYLQWRGRKHDSIVGILFYRLYWVNCDLKVIDAVIRRLEQEHDVIAVFCIGTGDADLGARPGDKVINSYFTGRIDLLINLQSVTLSRNIRETVINLRVLNVPIIHPVIIYNRTYEDWITSSAGLTPSEAGWAIVIPEFMGMTSMIPIGTRSPDEPAGGDVEWHDPIEERIMALGNLASRWVRLKHKKPEERKIAFILNNAPCSSIEATVGTAAHLDSLESVARILQMLKKNGYAVTAPENGKDLINTILDKKALSEFRWTSVQEIVAKGGALDLVGPDLYLRWFDELPESLITQLRETWGDPPGEMKDGVPPGMVYEGSLVITGVRYGNAVVCTQPKRGCVGARCDGQVCKILHDPQIPPPYHYLATYRYLTEIWNADVLVHVGTHGTLEFLPGKSVTLSSSCLPAAVLGDVPLIYIYNTDNPPEGTIAKRRTPSTLIGHMQSLMTESGLYGDLAELADRLDEYQRIVTSDPARAHALEHVIIDLIARNKMEKEIDIEQIKEHGEGMNDLITIAHESLTRIYNTQIPEGLHIFGEIPLG